MKKAKNAYLVLMKQYVLEGILFTRRKTTGEEVLIQMCFISVYSLGHALEMYIQVENVNTDTILICVGIALQDFSMRLVAMNAQNVQISFLTGV
jgi:hypothetical protein